MSLLNYTTKIDADKTAGEISKMLAKAGAQAILTEYDETSTYIKSISFRINLEGNVISFRLPSDWQPVLEVMQRDGKIPRSFKTQEQAVRVAWRIVKDWVEAQLALIETRMVTTTQVFLPYAVMKNGQTLFENVSQNPQFLLGDGN